LRIPVQYRIDFAAAIVVTLAFAAPRSPSGLVDIQTVAPHIKLDMRYATNNNFTKTTIYPVARCYLHSSTAERLARVQAQLEARGLGLKLYDCYRPLSAQRKFWSLVHDERYVANPAKGSRHNRGAAVDLTLVNDKGEELDMPSAFDDFTKRAHRDYMDTTKTAIDHREALERAMVKQGFSPMPTEWWHFDDPDWKQYPILDIDFSEL
jgi:D-alanyl-D-alanine dipeptidase